MEPFKFTWTIEDFSKLTCKTLTSDTFYTPTHQGMILIHPKDVNNGKALKMTLFYRPTEEIPRGTSVCSYAKLSLINQINDEMSITLGHDFNKRGSSQTHPFPPFVSSYRFLDYRIGFLVNDTCKIAVEFSSAAGSVENPGQDIAGSSRIE